MYTVQEIATVENVIEYILYDLNGKEKCRVRNLFDVEDLEGAREGLASHLGVEVYRVVLYCDLRVVEISPEVSNWRFCACWPLPS